MSKRQKRQVSSGTMKTPTGSDQVAVQRRFSGATEFNPDYTEIKKGIKRILYLAAFFIAVLIALTFILN